MRSGRSPVKVAKSHSQFFGFFFFTTSVSPNVRTKHIHAEKSRWFAADSSFSVAECFVTQIPLWSFNGLLQLMRYGKWHIEHITLPHAARVGGSIISQLRRTPLISPVPCFYLFGCLRVAKCSGAAEQTQERFQQSGFSEPNDGNHTTLLFSYNPGLSCPVRKHQTNGEHDQSLRQTLLLAERLISLKKSKPSSSASLENLRK